MPNKTPKNNNRPDRGKNRKAGNAAKLTAEEEKQQLAKQLGLKRRTIDFIEELQDNPQISNTEAYIRTHETNSRVTASREAYKLLKKPEVQIYSQATVRKAKRRIGSLVDSGNESIALKASQDIIDRTEGKAVQKTENTSRTVKVSLDLSGVRLGAHYIRPEQITGEN